MQRGLAAKFEHAGVYGITLDDVIVYIGKSNNILRRMSEHYALLNGQSENKYKVLKEAISRGHRMRFRVLYTAKKQDEREQEEEIGEREGYFIRKHLPPLNYQIPRENDWRHYDTNEYA